MKTLLHRLILPEQDRRLLPEGRVNGPMSWIVAIMIFLTALAAAAGIAIASLTVGIERQLENRLTVQIMASNQVQRDADAMRVEDYLSRTPFVIGTDRLSDTEAASLVEPWLGPEVTSEDFPIPILIDAALSPGAPPDAVDRLGAEIGRIAPGSRIDRQSNLVEPVGRLMRILAWVALGLMLLLAVATGAVVTLTARGALVNHRGVIDTIHLLGGTDGQISKLFQRRIALDALFGGILGFAGAAALVGLIEWQFAQTGLGLVDAPGLPWYGWLVIALLPAAGAMLASLVARIVIRRTLRSML